MRTTIIIEDSLDEKMRKMIPKKKLSEFINRCLWGHFERLERGQRLRELEKAYLRAAGGKKKTTDEFDVVDREEWPEW